MVDSFEKSVAWQKAQDLAVLVYKHTKAFPNDEKFGITNQLRRAVSSVSANIAEGFGRRTLNDKRHFYTMAYGSLLETKNFIYLAQKLSYLETMDVNELLDVTVTCQKLINGLLRSLKTNE